MSKRFVQSPWATDVIATTDATPTVSAPTSFISPSDSVVWCEIRGILRNTTTGVGAYVQVGRSFQNVGGALTALGALSSIIPIVGNAGLLTAVLDFTSSGTTIQPRVTGVALTNIEWLLDARYWVH